MNKKQLALAAMIPVLGLTIAGSTSAATDTTTLARVDRTQMEIRGERPERMGGNMENNPMNDTGLQKILGMTAEQIKTELQSGKKIDELITAKGLDKTVVMKQLSETREAEMKAKISADIASGKITQAQADKMKIKKEENELQRLTTTAAALGTTVEKLKADIASGKPLDETIASLGITKAQAMQKIRDARQAEMKTKLAQDVASGKITQTRADAMVQKMIENDTKRETAISAALGMTVDELTTAIASGKTVDDLITEKGLSKETVKATINSELDQNGKGFFKRIGEKLKGIFGGTKAQTISTVAI